jgi:flagellar biosynthesis chaperone FliJ
MSEENEVVPLETLARVYRKIYLKAQEIQKQLDKLEEQKTEIKNAMKDQMRQLGISSVKTAGGNISLSTKTRYYTDDWDSFKTFVIENDALDLFEHRIAQKNMALFLEENPGKVPAGLSSLSENTVTVTKPTT